MDCNSLQSVLEGISFLYLKNAVVLPQMEFTSEGTKQLVSVTVGGDFTVRSVTIVPGGTADRFELEQDMVTALNLALNSAKKEIESRMKEMTGGISLPGVF